MKKKKKNRPCSLYQKKRRVRREIAYILPSRRSHDVADNNNIISDVSIATRVWRDSRELLFAAYILEPQTVS